MPFARVNPGDLIQAQNLDQLVDSLNGVSGKGIPVAETSVNDATNYALSVQNLEATNSRALNVLKSDGSLLIRADVNGVSLGAPLNPTAGSLQGTALQNGTVTNAKLASDTARLNLLTDGGFEVWSRGNGPFTANAAYTADRWAISLASSSMSVTRDTANAAVGSIACASCVYTHVTQGWLVQTPEVSGIAGRQVTLSMRVKTTTANAVRVYLNSGLLNTPAYSAYHSGGGTYETLSVSFTYPANETTVYVGVIFAASCTAYIDNAMLVVGSQAADYAPLHPADDLARCLRYYELLVAGSTSSLGVGQAANATQGIAYFSYLVSKAVTPTVTFAPSTTMAVTNAATTPISMTNVSAVTPNVRSTQVLCTVAGGLVAGNAILFQAASGQTATIGIEANP